MPVHRFPFAFAPAYRIAGLPFWVTPSSAIIEVGELELRARFGPWQVRTPMTNIAGVEITGPYRMLTTIGPAHLSFTDRGLTMATNGDRGVCIRFREPVAGIEPTGRIRHPGLTVTVADCDGLLARLYEAGAPAS
jgi:hypothetical protein